MAGAAGEGLFLSLYEGCISTCDITDRRPYHRNCQCALHDKSLTNCPHALPKTKTVSYPLRRAWSEGCLAVSSAVSSCHTSPSSSPAPLPGVHAAAGKQQSGSYKELDDDDDLFESTAKGVKMDLKGN